MYSNLKNIKKIIQLQNVKVRNESTVMNQCDMCKRKRGDGLSDGGCYRSVPPGRLVS